MRLAQELKRVVGGDVLDDEKTLQTYSRDASLFVVHPKIVVSPKNSEDIKALVKFVSKNNGSANLKRAKGQIPNHKLLSLTARAAGTCMSGGPLTESIVVNFMKYFTKIRSIHDHNATVEPGVFYRDLEKETLKYGLLFPPYPASKSICAVGGIVNNNAGGEKTLKYGKTENYVEKLKMVLSDGNEYEFLPLDAAGLRKKLKQKNFEGEIYQRMHKLVTKNHKLITSAKPDVTKNSAGYQLWNIWDKKEKIFDLSRIFIGAQGTLGLMTEATLHLIPIKKHARMVVIFLKDIKKLSDLVPIILKHDPESFETYDDNTLKLAIKFFPSFAKLMGVKNLWKIAWSFLPEFWMTVTGGLPKLILQVEFVGDDAPTLDNRVAELVRALQPYDVKIRAPKTQFGAQKYWTIRRESFNLLRHHIKDRHTAPFIDDFAIKAERLPDFLPELDKILEKYNLIYTIAGHVGDGNLHIIPLMNLGNESERKIIPELSRKVYELVMKYGGTTTGEHNDGLIRSYYLKQMYGEKVYKLFEEVKKIFDPLNIFNPGKKVHASLEYAMEHVRRD
ncbi:MAG: FAD-binding oxidoreductase [Candidatus Liptonbacteria bacterium]|nr:FAD-binding oxidoreductase [Candidatus Liptonbacteria bacterium]